MLIFRSKVFIYRIKYYDFFYNGVIIMIVFLKNLKGCDQMNSNIDILYSLVIILISFFVSFQSIKDFKSGKYKPYFFSITSNRFLLYSILGFISYFILSSISSDFIFKFATISLIFIILLTENVLNLKCYFSKKEKRIIVETSIGNMLMIGFVFFLYYI